MKDDNSFLGIGWGFPPTFVKDGQNRVQPASGIQDINESLEILLSTSLGERIMQPGFGANLNRHARPQGEDFNHVGASHLATVGQWFDDTRQSDPVAFTDKLGAPLEYKFDVDELRASVGIGVQWLAPLGLFRFSYAYPLNEYRGNDRFYGDEIERFQFSIGQAF